MATRIVFLGVLISWYSFGLPNIGAQTRFEQLTKRFATTPDQAKVLTAGYLGGKGTEWLVSGGFQPDGTIVLIGVSVGPELKLAGIPETVFGKDSPAPEPWKPSPVLKNGKAVLNKDGTPKLRPANWRDPAGTAFIVRMSRDANKILSVSRFPWKAGGVTSAVVDKEGAIYLAGPAREGIMAIGGEILEEKLEEATAPKGDSVAIYLAKVDASAKRVLWLRCLKGASAAPNVTLDARGDLRLEGPDVRIYSLDGRLKSKQVIPGGITSTTAIHPFDGSYARGGETRNWNTGREPYRDPYLYIYRPNGKLRYELYHWDGPYVGLDNLRLVSDSVIRLVRYDSEGNLILYAWSDGGNSVMYREPFDVRTPAKNFRGLGISAWGAGVLSCAYLIKLDGKSFRVIGGTLWLAFLADKDKPNSIKIDALDFAGDGSICVGGDAAWGLIQTGNALTQEPVGPYVTIFNADYTSLRFSSAMPACGKAEVRNESRWGIVHGKVNGQERVLFLSGAKENDGSIQARPAPAVGWKQPFGGGELDGYFLLLDLGAAQKQAPDQLQGTTKP